VAAPPAGGDLTTPVFLERMIGTAEGRCPWAESRARSHSRQESDRSSALGRDQSGVEAGQVEPTCKSSVFDLETAILDHL
jgi:hypothetical protein